MEESGRSSLLSFPCSGEARNGFGLRITPITGAVPASTPGTIADCSKGRGKKAIILIAETTAANVSSLIAKRPARTPSCASNFSCAAGSVL